MFREISFAVRADRGKNDIGMAIRFQILGSSSAGNCALLITENCRILIDAGFSGRRICQMLESCDCPIDAIDAVFLTHEHADHASGLTGLSRIPHLQVFANHGTAQAVQAKLKRRANWQLFETGTSFLFRDLEINAFSIPHDAYDPVGFVFSQGGDSLFNPRRSVAWCVDLGYVPQLVRERVRAAQILVLESNHDHRLLDDDPHRPWSVKQRIKGRHGHLSNEAAREFLDSEPAAHWENVCLAHLSRDCNDIDLVKAPYNGGRNYDVSVVDPKAVALPPMEI